MKKVVSNYFYNLSYQVLTLIMPLITIPYVSRVLGAKGVGIYSYAYSLMQMFILAGGIGLGIYGQREVAYVQKDEHKRSVLFWELFCIRIVTFSVALAAFWGSLVLHGQYSYIYVIMMIDIVASLLDVSWFFQGMEEFKKIVLVNSLCKLMGIAAIFLFVKSISDLQIYTLCHSLTLLCGNVALWGYLRHYLKEIEVRELHCFRHLRGTLGLFLPQVALSLYAILDKSMIGFLTGVEEVGYYTQAQKIIRMILAILTSLSAVMLPRIASLYQQKDMKTIHLYMEKSIQFMCALAFPMMLGMAAISTQFVPWFYGEGFEKVAPNLILIAPIFVLSALGSIMGTQYLLPLGRQKEYTISVFVGSIVNILMNFLLIPKYMSLGAAVATVFSELCVDGTQIYFLRKEMKVLQMMWKNMLYFLCSLLMAIPVYLLAAKMSSSLWNTIFLAGMGGILYVLLLLLFRDPVLMGLMKKLER